MDDENICPNCGHQLRIKREYPSFALICDHCGWGVATTMWDPIDLDETEYVIRLAEGNIVNKKTLSLISQMTGLNFILSKKLIESFGILWSGKAREAKEKIDFLKEQEISFTITPEFPY